MHVAVFCELISNIAFPVHVKDYRMEAIGNLELCNFDVSNSLQNG